MRAKLQIVCFLLVVCTADCLINFLRNIREYGKQRGNQNTAASIRDATDDTTKLGSIQEVKIPERLFSKEVALRRKSYCYQARLEFGKLCGLRSASERARLASLVTNCHLEVSGRPVFVWDPVKKLEDADDNYVYLVMQFVPLMSDVCQKAGHSPILTQLVADTESNDDLRKKIDELQDATERLFEANRQSSEFVEEYINMSVDASRQLMQVLTLSAAIKKANDAIDTQREAIHLETNAIKAELRSLAGNSISHFNSLFGRFDSFQSQVSNMEAVVGQLQSDSHVTSMFLKEPLEAISNSSEHMQSPQGSTQEYLTVFPFGPFTKVLFLKDIILGPIKLSERIRYLESNRFLGPFAKDIFSSIQLLLVLVSIYFTYTVVTTLTKIVEAILRFAAILKPFQPLATKLRNLFRMGYEPQPALQHQRIEEYYSEHLSASVSKALAGSQLAEKISEIVRNDGTDTRFSLLFSRIAELDMRLSQISQDVRLLHHTLQYLDRFLERQPGTSPKPPNDVSMITRGDVEGIDYGHSSKALDGPSRSSTTAGENNTSSGQRKSSETRFSDDTSQREECDNRDNAKRKETKTVTPKRELTRRRSARKKR